MTAALVLILAQAGGGSGSFGGGGGGGGGGSGGAGAGGSGSGEGDPYIGLVIVAIFVLVFLWGTYKAMKLRRKRKERVARARTASAVAADDDPHFAADAVERDAAALFHAIQVAWHERDRERLDQLVGADLMVEWRRRLDDFDRKGWHNQVEVKTGPQVEYIGMVNREDDDEDRVTVRLTSTMRSVVVDTNGKVLKKNESASEIVSIAEYWTLLRRGDRWILESIEQDSEGAHHLDAPLVPAPWTDDAGLHDAAVVELAQADAAPAGTRFGELVDIDFADDARAAALDLSTLDERFAPHVLEVAARRALTAWSVAVDGDDAALHEIAEPAAMRELLYGGDATKRTRVVVRGPRLEAAEIVALDGHAEPPAFVVEARVRGRRYVENRDTLDVISGSRESETSFAERWRLELSEDAEDDNPWRVAATGAMAG